MNISVSVEIRVGSGLFFHRQDAKDPKVAKEYKSFLVTSAFFAPWR